MSLESTVEDLVRAFRAKPTMRAGSLIVTVFGDAIAPRGGTVWIGSLIRALNDFGINERLVRTSVYRLAQDDWLEVEQLGRRSYYRLSPAGIGRFEQATVRIYGDPRQSWDGEWCLVLLADLDGAARDKLQRELGWSGFGAISNRVLAHPAADPGRLEDLLQKAGADRDVVVLRAETVGRRHDEAMRNLVRKSWNLDELDALYAGFVARYRPVFRALGRSRKMDARLAFQVRTLLIQDYRRILLRDPLLPTEMLPAGWHGTAAYRLCRNLYRRVYAAADAFMTSEFETGEGALPPPAPDFYRRFGGLD